MPVTLKKENIWLWIVLLLVLIGTYFAVKPHLPLEKRLFESAQAELSLKKYSAAVEDFERVVSYSPDSETGLLAAKLGGETSLYETKNFKKAIGFFRHIIQHGQDPAALKYAQKKLAEIYYEKLSDYPQAIVEYSRMLQTQPGENEEQEVREKIARAYYYGANFEQAVLEVEEFKERWPKSAKNFEMLSLKASALMGEKKFDGAIETFGEIQETYPDHEGIFEVYLNKSLAYEEKKDWDKAISTLQEIKGRYQHPDLLEMRIKSIIRRKEKKKAP